MPTQNIYDLVDTWNASGTAFTAIKMNVTDTASASGSLLMDLQVGGSSKFKADKAGGVTFAGNLQVANNGVYIEGTAAGTVRVPGVNGYFGFTTNTVSTALSTIDLIITRRAAASLRLGAADAASAVAQTLGVQSVVAGTTNTAGADFTIAGSQGTGTGAGGSLIFQTAPAGTTGTAQNSFQNSLVINGDGEATFTVKNTSGTPTLQIAKSGSSSIQITTAATFTIGSSASSLTLNANAGSSPIYAACSYLNIGTAANNDVQLYRDAADTLAQRRSTNAQTFRIYNTYTDASNYERAKLAWSSNTLQIGSEAAGTGTGRDVAFQRNGLTYFTLNSSFELALGVNRRLSVDDGGWIDIAENASAPAAPAANKARVYAEDNGSGKTRLMVRFPTGAAVQIAIEP